MEWRPKESREVFVCVFGLESQDKVLTEGRGEVLRGCVAACVSHGWVLKWGLGISKCFTSAVATRATMLVYQMNENT